MLKSKAALQRMVASFRKREHGKENLFNYLLELKQNHVHRYMRRGLLPQTLGHVTSKLYPKHELPKSVCKRGQLPLLAFSILINYFFYNSLYNKMYISQLFIHLEKQKLGFLVVLLLVLFFWRFWGESPNDENYNNLFQFFILQLNF